MKGEREIEKERERDVERDERRKKERGSGMKGERVSEREREMKGGRERERSLTGFLHSFFSFKALFLYISSVVTSKHFLYFVYYMKTFSRRELDLKIVLIYAFTGPFLNDR